MVMTTIFKAWYFFLFILFLGLTFVAVCLHRWYGVLIFGMGVIALGVIVWSIRND